MHGSLDRSRPWLRVFGAPIVLGVLTTAGLLIALIWGNFGKYIAWVTVGAPVAVVTWVWLGRRLEKRR
ncbi:hypothetical protein JQ596_28230 [Bradyrhizobium manausense]|uniref:hypothetical protein n=1 Tax=Bradyrhizobium TaxID=374 RepID=UPI001BAB9178|nr:MULTISPECIES: hypothetical protein [Bradyrhizobium]MBR0829431.1 hypothetical protein [Bradyrhizobium manausense]UVO25808.1 hypothetical protein KUF59_24870 [Bradyrhizobium arachidis]